MHTSHHPFLLAGTSVHRVDFQPATLSDADLLWLPHHAQLARAATKRKAEHLAGRLAAAHALREYGISTVPGIGQNGAPQWPDGLAGSISHTSSCALAVVSQNALTGIDGEVILSSEEAEDIKDGIINADEEVLLRCCSLPFALALTLVFSAKESLFKALYPVAKTMMGFDSACVTALDEKHMTLALTRPLAGFDKGDTFSLPWLRDGAMVITLLLSAPAALPARQSPQR